MSTDITLALVLRPDVDLNPAACGGAERIALELSKTPLLSKCCRILARSPGKRANLPNTHYHIVGDNFDTKDVSIFEGLRRVRVCVFWDFLPSVDLLEICKKNIIFFSHYRDPTEWELTKHHLEHIAHCFFHSQWLREEFLSIHGDAVPSSDLRAGVDPEQFGFRGRRENTVIGFAGVLLIEKGVVDLVRAFRQLPASAGSSELWLVGSSCLWGSGIGTEAPLAELLGDRIRLLGRVPYEEMPSLWAQVSVMVMPSHYRECLPLTTLEALAAGCRVIASNVEGNHEILDGGSFGLLYPPGDVPALVRSLVKAIKDSRAHDDDWRIRARERTHLFTWKAGAERIAGVLDALGEW